jgi:hypothetical protein
MFKPFRDFRSLGQPLLRRGAKKAYAAARRAELVDLPGVVPLRLDVTDPASVAAAAEAAGDVTLTVFPQFRGRAPCSGTVPGPRFGGIPGSDRLTDPPPAADTKGRAQADQRTPEPR